MSASADEAERQRRLLASLLASSADTSTLPTRETGPRALRGLQAYRANADASAARALATAFPTVQMLLGDENFEQLAREFWRADPPLRGDLGEWGGHLADWIAQHPGLVEWPYLADSARLDWALHACERAEDATLDADSIARLGDTDPSRLVLLLMPGAAMVESRWPVGALHAAHRSEDEQAFEAVREAIAQQRGEAVFVARRGFKAVIAVVDAPTARWTQALLAGSDLAVAIAQAGEGFDFTAWLTQALSSNWVKGIRVRPDSSSSQEELA
jgi:hypothetical protein